MEWCVRGRTSKVAWRPWLGRQNPCQAAHGWPLWYSLLTRSIRALLWDLLHVSILSQPFVPHTILVTAPCYLYQSCHIPWCLCDMSQGTSRYITPEDQICSPFPDHLVGGLRRSRLWFSKHPTSVGNPRWLSSRVSSILPGRFDQGEVVSFSFG